MRHFRNFFALVMAVLMLLSATTGALAASYTASTWSDLETAFADDSGENVSIDLTTDIDSEGTLEAKENIKYTISTKNDSTLGGAELGGKGTVEINADLTNTLYTEDSVTVTVNGNIESLYNDGVWATDDSIVTVNGDIEAGDDGVYVYDNAKVTVDGNVAGKNNGIYAADNSVIEVTGDVSGLNGKPNEVDYDDPEDYSDGGDGIYAENNAKVTVTGNVTGGNSYGTYGYGGDAITAYENATVTVGGNATSGNVTANPATKANEDFESYAGYGVIMDNMATVMIGGNVVAGSTNGDRGVAGMGVYIYYCYMTEDAEDGYSVGKLIVGGYIKSGTSSAGNGIEGNDIVLSNSAGEALSDYLLPELSVGAYDTFFAYGFTEEEWDELLETLVVTGLPQEAIEDSFWWDIYAKILAAKPGDTITINAGVRTVVPTFVLKAAEKHGVTLVIHWDGGENVVVTGVPENKADQTGFRISELAELVKQ